MAASRTALDHRPTSAERSITEEMAADRSFRSAQAVYAALRADGRAIGLSTVYRRLQLLADSGEADTIHTPAGETLYRLCGQDARHHHHLVCRSCGLAVEVQGQAVERWADKMARDNDFAEVDHSVELYGLCKDCTAEKAG